MINLTNETDDIVEAIKFRAEKLTETINVAVNSDAGDGVVNALKDRQDKLNDLIDRIENAQEEDGVFFALMTESEMEQIE